MATIRHKRNNVPGEIPEANDLVLGELAINTSDGKLFTKKADGSVVDLTTSGGVDGGEVEYDSLIEGLMSFWLFDRNSGSVKDVSGNGNHLYEAFSEKKTVGAAGSALKLDRRNFYYAENAFVGHKTISLWVRVEARFKGAYNGGTTYSQGDVVSYGGKFWMSRASQGPASSSSSSGPSQENWKELGPDSDDFILMSIGAFGEQDAERIYIKPNGRVAWSPEVGSGPAEISSPSEIPYATWRNFVFVHDAAGGKVRLYENGSQTAVADVTGAGPSDALAVFMVGLSGMVPFEVDCVGVWSRALTASEVQTLHGGGNPYVVEPPTVPGINYENFTTFNVSGAVSSMSASVTGNSNSIFPAFNQTIYDYGILTGSPSAGADVTYSVTVDGISYPGVGSVGGLVRVTNGTNNYYIRLLPSDIPLGTVTTPPGPSYVPGYYITTSRRDINVNNYNIVYNHHGLPVWYVQNSGTPHLAQHGNDRNKIGVSRNGTGTRFSMELTNDSTEMREFSFLPTMRNGNTYSYNFGNHEFLEVKSPPEARGNIIYNTFVAQPAGGSQAITDKAFGVYVQEQTPQKTIGWEWWTSDRFDQTNLAQNASFFHMNSVDIHPVTGDMLLSCRQCSAIVCVDRSTKDVKWVIQGASQPWGDIIQTANQHTLDNAKWLTLEGEPELEGYQYLGPEGQHHARWALNVDPLTPGNDVISIFDNQAGFFPGSTNSPKVVTSLVRSGTTVTGTAAVHGFTTGSYVKVAGANEPAFNGVFTVTVVNSSTFTYTVTESGSGSATGTLTATRALTYWPHSANSPAARGVIYEIDLLNEKALHRASVFSSNGTSGYLGSYQIMMHDNGSFSHVLNFTQQHPQFVEYGDEGTGADPTGAILAIDFPGDLYRVTKVPLDYFDIDYLRATAGSTPVVVT